MSETNVLGGPLQPCGTDPVNGFYRDGSCTVGPEDVGVHEPVDEHDVGLAEQLRGAQGQQPGVAGAGPDQGDAAGAHARTTASAGHTSTHAPQSVQRSWSTVSGTATTKAADGQVSRHAPQAVQASVTV